MTRQKRPAVDLDALSEDELIDLNHRIVERLKALRESHTRDSMAAFKVGDRVSFTTPDGRTMSGLLIRANRKTVSVLADNQQQWNISPGLLTLVEDGAMLKEAVAMIQASPLALTDQRKRR